MYQEKNCLKNHDETDEASAYAHAALDSPAPPSDCLGAFISGYRVEMMPLRGPRALQEFKIPRVLPFPSGDNYIRNLDNMESFAETITLREG